MKKNYIIYNNFFEIGEMMDNLFLILENIIKIGNNVLIIKIRGVFNGFMEN